MAVSFSIGYHLTYWIEFVTQWLAASLDFFWFQYLLRKGDLLLPAKWDCQTPLCIPVPSGQEKCELIKYVQQRQYNCAKGNEKSA